MPRLTGEQVAQVAHQAGFDGWELTQAVAVSFAENGSHDPAAQHRNSDGSTDTGLWQINSVHGIPAEQLKNPLRNAQAAWEISSHGMDWRPWTTYASGASGGQVGAAQRAIDHANLGENFLGVTDQLGGAGNAIKNAEKGAAGGLFGWGEAIVNLVKALLDRKTWVRLAMIAGGLVLALLGLLFLGRAVGAEIPTPARLAR